jgi:type III pantothenate kinase
LPHIPTFAGIHKNKLMNLVIDMGNTSVKLGLFSSAELKAHLVLPEFSMSELETFLKKNDTPENVILSSVVKKNEELETYLENNFLFIKLDHTTPLPIEKLYKTPETLGNDRIAAAVGANNLFPSQNVLAIDTGTCIKYDLVNAANQYLGGNISPGIEMRFKALNAFTAQLPLVTKAVDNDIYGSSTEQAIRLGVQLGAIEEVKGIINRFQSRYTDMKVILTGGDMAFFDGELKNHIFADPFLTLRGLNVILNHNADKENS